MNPWAHVEGDCWPDTCPYCAAEDEREAAETDEETNDE